MKDHELILGAVIIAGLYFLTTGVSVSSPISSNAQKSDLNDKIIINEEYLLKHKANGSNMLNTQKTGVAGGVGVNNTVLSARKFMTNSEEGPQNMNRQYNPETKNPMER